MECCGQNVMTEISACLILGLFALILAQVVAMHMVADKLKGQWFCIVYFAKLHKKTREEVS